MLPFFHLHATVSKSIISCLIIPSSPKPLIPSYSPIRFFHFQTPKRFACIRSQMSSSSSTQVAAEYAKSGRSSCKKCSQPIEAKALRLGLISRDARGFDATKWHHLDCFDFGSQNVASVEKIKGFQSLKVLARISILGFCFVWLCLKKIKVVFWFALKPSLKVWPWFPFLSLQPNRLSLSIWLFSCLFIQSIDQEAVKELVSESEKSREEVHVHFSALSWVALCM